MARSRCNTERLCVCTAAAVLSLAVACGDASLTSVLAQSRRSSAATYSPKRMSDGKEWTTRNLSVETAPSYCYDVAETNCRQYGRLYTWESARSACQSLGDGWRLPTEDEWRQLAKHYGGVFEDSNDKGATAYQKLMTGGSSGFAALLGGSRSGDGLYSRLGAHGFYWTASEESPGTAWYYNFGHGSRLLYRQSGGEKLRAFAIRCVRQ